MSTNNWVVLSIPSLFPVWMCVWWSCYDIHVCVYYMSIKHPATFYWSRKEFTAETFHVEVVKGKDALSCFPLKHPPRVCHRWLTRGGFSWYEADLSSFCIVAAVAVQVEPPDLHLMRLLRWRQHCKAQQFNPEASAPPSRGGGATHLKRKEPLRKTPKQILVPGPFPTPRLMIYLTSASASQRSVMVSWCSFPPPTSSLLCF